MSAFVNETRPSDWVRRERKPTKISSLFVKSTPQAKQAESVGVTVKKMYKSLIPLKAWFLATILSYDIIFLTTKAQIRKIEIRKNIK